MTRGTAPKPARVVDYVEIARINGQLRCMRCIKGPLKEARALRDIAVANGGTLRFEQVDHRMQEAYYEVVLPKEPSK